MQKKANRFLAMLLAVALVLSLVPLSVFAEETPTVPFTSISAGGTDITSSAAYEGTVTFTGYETTYESIPHYHVTVPSGTTSVTVTYPSTCSLQVNSDTSCAYGYYADIPGWTGGGLDVPCTVGSDGSVTMTIDLSQTVTAADGTTTVKSFILNEDGEGAAFAPELSSEGNYAPVNFFTFEVASSGTNTAPAVVSGAPTTASVQVGSAWELDVSTLFTDADNDTLTYSATVNEVSQELSGSTLSYTPATEGTYTVVLTANDGTASTSHTITLTATAADSNRVPVLKDSSNTGKTVTVPTNYAYNVTELQNNQIFEDPDGDTLNYTSYYYEYKVGDGEWSTTKYNFEPSLFGFTTIQFTETVEGTYYYRFYAYDGKGFSTETWTLTMIVSDEANMDFTFYVGRDHTSTSTSYAHPVIELYETAGFKDGYDYIGSFEDSEGNIVYIKNPRDYTIVEESSTKAYIEDETSSTGRRYIDGYRHITFTDSLFGKSASGDETATASGTVDSNAYYRMYYASIPADQYSVRAYTTDGAYLGGQSLTLPTEVNVDGGTGGGTSIYLREISVYTTSKKTDSTYFTHSDYTVEVDMPIMGGSVHSGTYYTSGNYTYYPFMMYAAGNASLYNIYANPTDTSTYIFSQSINNTTAAGYTVVTKSVSINTAVNLTVTVPKDAEFKLYFQYNNFNTQVVDPVSTSEGTTTKTITYKISKSNSNYTWRLSDTTGTYVTKAGWLKSYTADGTAEFSFESGDATNKKTHSFTGLGTTVLTRDEAEIQAYLTPTGYLSTTKATTIRAYRLWQIINSDTANIMIEPDFHYQVLQGSENDITSVTDNDDNVLGGNASGNWISVTPTGTDIVTMYYDAIDVYGTDGTHGTHGGLYPATNPERVSVFVITNQADAGLTANIAYNSNGAASSRPTAWDYNYDNWFYLSTDTAPTLDFTVTGTPTSVQYALVTTNDAMTSTLSDWYDATATSTGYSADLLGFRTANTKGGTVIIKMTNSNGESYCLVRVAEISVTISNASHPGETVFMPGDDVTISFDNTYRGIYKYSGIFNPTTYYLYYTSGDTSVNTTVSQYQQMDSAKITLTIPSSYDASQNGTYTFTNGYTYGSMYSAASPFSTLYNMTDTGVGTNFNAVTVNFCLNRFPDITIDVAEEVFYDVKLDVTNVPSGSTYTVTLMDSTGAEVSATNGVYEDLPYGTYTYTVACAGCYYVYDTFTLGSADASNVVSGVLTKTIALTQSTAWDGTTTSEPTLTDGVYQIGTAAELAWFAAYVNAGNYSINAVLTQDIDLAYYNWTPIGGSSSSTAYKGTFDGAGHTIKNLGIYYSATTTTSPYKGLFGYVNGTSSAYATIKDLNVTGKMFLTSTGSVSSAYIGGVAAYANYTNFSGVTSDVDITVTRVAGNWSYVGGIAGRSTYSTFTNCGNTGDIVGYQYVGGITGYATGDISNCYNGGNVTGYGYVGGIVSSSTKTVTACYNNGTVTGSSTYVGGIIAYASGTTAVVSYSYNRGNVVSTNAVYTGALIGYMNNASGTTTKLYYLSSTADRGIGVAAGTAQTATAVSAADMQVATFYQELNAGSNDDFIYATNYPILLWQAPAPSVGDVNGDGVVDNADAVLLEEYVYGMTEDIDFDQADVNGDNDVTEDDLNMLSAYVSKDIYFFPVDDPTV